MSNAPIYLDHNATTPVLPEVVDAMIPYLREHWGNPSSDHQAGRRARQGVERARAQVAQLLGAAPDEIVFTSGGTEASNLAIRGALEARQMRGSVVTSVIEHPATSAPCDWLEARGVRVERVPVDEAGRLDLEVAREGIEEQCALVTVMHANNETGVMQPIAELAKLARRVGALMHTDAAQSVGKVDVDVDALGVDLLTVAGHKVYGPKGVGAMYVRRGTTLAPLVRGAGHERGLRPGTENVASIVGLGRACEIIGEELQVEAERVRALRDTLHDRLREAIPRLAINGHLWQRLPNTLNVRFPGVTGRALLERAPEVSASTGSACHAGQELASAVVLAMGVAQEEALGSVRLTLGRASDAESIGRAAAALIRAWRELT